MEKIANAIVKSFGGKPNGTPETTCFDRVGFAKQVLMALCLAFTTGATVMGFIGRHKDLPAKVDGLDARIGSVEEKVNLRMSKVEQSQAEIITKLNMIYDEVRDNRSGGRHYAAGNDR